MHGKDGLNVVFNILSFVILGGAIALLVLAFTNKNQAQLSVNYYTLGSIGCAVLFIIMRILLNIARNVRVMTDNTYDLLSLLERYVKNIAANGEPSGKKEKRTQEKLEKMVKKEQERKATLTSNAVSQPAPAPKPTPAPIVITTASVPAPTPLSYEEAKPLFRGKIFCAKCGSPMQVFNTSKGIPVAKCPKSDNGDCSNPLIRIDKIEKDFVMWYKVAYEKDDYNAFTTKAFLDSVNRIKVLNGEANFESVVAGTYSPANNVKKSGIDI